MKLTLTSILHKTIDSAENSHTRENYEKSNAHYIYGHVASLDCKCIVCLGLTPKEDSDSTCAEARADMILHCPHVIKKSCMAQKERILIRDLSVGEYR